ncbi:hypothetical protein GW17_00014261 [Ensete ventricosum]|nr:hypothetical protein GW17_00014261 [Ensete ventricosum]
MLTSPPVSSLPFPVLLFSLERSQRRYHRERIGSAMGPMAVAEEMGLELTLCAMRTVGGFLKEASAIESGDGGRAARLEESIRSLEEEKRKIEAFKRELPLCMHLLGEGSSDASYFRYLFWDSSAVKIRFFTISMSVLLGCSNRGVE